VLQDPDATGIGVVFDGLDRAIGSPVGWERLFKRFEALELLFAYEEPAPADDPAEAWALFERTRIEASNRLDRTENEEQTDLDLARTGTDDSEFDAPLSPATDARPSATRRRPIRRTPTTTATSRRSSPDPLT
jgi:hypothetical protein